MSTLYDIIIASLCIFGIVMLCFQASYSSFFVFLYLRYISYMEHIVRFFNLIW